ncbi:46501_t:CDS:2 [Gigaspora margarita]|uniref:46501_t:CDS:1 n=1 Tax=Gigaspora margarita TaxID=4874 RepID=A0ABM8W224_GIGMA|nr:46501_t:CDS:2 [Gigaspora margarita]
MLYRENANVDSFFEEFDRDELLQANIKLPDFDMNNNYSVMEEIFDFRLLEEPNIIEEGSISQQNTNANQDWLVDNIFQSF